MFLAALRYTQLFVCFLLESVLYCPDLIGALLCVLTVGLSFFLKVSLLLGSPFLS